MASPPAGLGAGLAPASPAHPVERQRRFITGPDAFLRLVEAVRAAAGDGTSYGAPTEREVLLAEEICGVDPSLIEAAWIDQYRLVREEQFRSLDAVAKAYTDAVGADAVSLGRVNWTVGPRRPAAAAAPAPAPAPAGGCASTAPATAPG